jgi:hypothetical protein
LGVWRAHTCFSTTGRRLEIDKMIMFGVVDGLIVEA